MDTETCCVCIRFVTILLILSSSLIVWIDLSSVKFSQWVPKKMYLETLCKGRSRSVRSMISTPMQSAYGTTNLSSIVILNPSCPISEILQVFCQKSYLTPIPREIGESSHWTRLLMEVICVSTLEVTQPTYLSYINITDRQRHR